MIKNIFIFLVAFLLGALAMSLYATLGNGDISMPMGVTGTIERPSPQDHIKEDHIQVYSDRVTIMVDNPQWASFADTNSMDPVLDAGNNAIEVVPKSMDEIAVGDIVSYTPSDGQGTIIHRVIYKGNDDKGEYLVMKGDNNPTADPDRVRFAMVKRMVVGIIY